MWEMQIKKNEITLSEYIIEKSVDIEQFLNIAINIANVLDSLHQNDTFYKNINSSNILYNSKENSIKLVDIDSVDIVLNKIPDFSENDSTDKGLYYISPEQTGRFRREIDHSTDLYSLGILFYEMITGTLPFTKEDPIELIYAHIAKVPLSPDAVRNDIPSVVSEIIMKLISKEPRDRYQSAYGIKHDLEQCLASQQKGGNIEHFEIRQKDISDKFVIPEKLYGREKEIKVLLDAYENAKNGKSEMVFVEGYSGIGKSSLVNEIKKSASSKTLFISGKFDQYIKDMPYSALLEAFTELADKLLSLSDYKIKKWKEKILNAVGGNGQLLTSNIPKLELIIGKQDETFELSPVEAKNRFRMLVHDFLKVFTSEENSLVIFLDDLQWADKASLELLSTFLFSTGIENLMFIGAFRDNEISEQKLYDLMGDEIKDNSESIKKIELKPLSFDKSDQMISEVLRSEKQTRELTTLCLAKTEGNPFFLKQFLHILRKDNLIYFDREKREWAYDASRIKDKEIPDDIVSMMVYKIKKLEPSFKEILKVASCIGSIFDVHMVSNVTNKPLETVTHNLSNLSKEYLVQKLPEEDLYEFAHDRIEQASHSLLEETEKKELNLQIGRLMLKDGDNIVEEKIFDLVHSLNVGFDLITERDELDRLAELNLQAARKAKKAAAHEAAFDYLQIAVQILDKDSWNIKYDLAFKIYLETAEAAYLTYNFEQMKSLIKIVFENSKSDLDKARAYEIEMKAYLVIPDYKKALTIGRKALKLVGVRIPEKSSKFNILQDEFRVRVALLGKTVDDLAVLPEMTDPVAQTIARLLIAITPSAYFINSDLLIHIGGENIVASIKYGNAIHSPSLYVTYGVILCKYEKLDRGYQLGELAMKLIDKLGTADIDARSIFIFYQFVSYWKKHVKESLKPLYSSYLTALKIGELEYGAAALAYYYEFLFFSGSNLDNLFDEVTNNISKLKDLKQILYIVVAQLIQQVSCDLSRGKAFRGIDGEWFNEREASERCGDIAGNNVTMFIIYTIKLYLNYLFGYYDRAMESVFMVEKFDQIVMLYVKCLFNFYESLTNLAIYNDASKSDKKQYLKKVSKNQKLMKKWAKSAPMNFLHKYLLVEAELGRVEGKDNKASDLYDQAIDQARKNEYINEEAMANELAGKYYLQKGKEKIAKTYMHEAYLCYKKWGANAKLVDIEAKYPDFFEDLVTAKGQPEKTINTKETKAVDTGKKELDLLSFMKASETISDEASFDKKLERLISAAIENSGATKGVLILKKGENDYIKTCFMDGVFVEVAELPLNKADNISIPIINYVSKTNEQVVLSSANAVGMFENDPYIKQNSVKSLLCIPAIYKQQLFAIFYLENNLIEGVFTAERVEILKILASQISILVENSILYEDYSRGVEELRQKMLREKKAEKEKKDKYGSAKLLDEEISDYFRVLEEYMEQEKPYRNAFLTLQDVADNLAIPTHALSQTINSRSNLTFNNYMNNYRLEEVKEKMKNPKYKNENILLIAMECGFNSKSSFYSYFKNCEGMTPSKYRRIHN